MKCTSVIALLVGGSAALGQTVVPPFDIPYSIVALGTPPGVPNNLGGISFKPGDPNRMYIMGGANGPGGAMYEIGVRRDAGGYIDGWDGEATLVSSAANNDGGLTEVPGSGGTMMFTAFPNNALGQIRPGSAVPDRYDSLTPLGVAGTTGTCQFVPIGFPGAGNLMIASYSSNDFYVLPLTLDPGPAPHTYAPGTAGASLSNVGGAATGPEGIIYVPPLSPIFESTPTMLVCAYSIGKVVAFDVGPQGQPVVSTARDFIVGLGGAEGGCLDPLTNTFLFSTFGGGAGVIAVPGFTPPQCGASDIGRNGGIEGHDGRLNNNDFIVFVQRFFASDMRADVGSAGGLNGSDGFLDNNDFIAFITTFFAGCT